MLFSTETNNRTDTNREDLCFSKNKVKLVRVILQNLKCFNVEMIFVIICVSRTLIPGFVVYC